MAGKYFWFWKASMNVSSRCCRGELDTVSYQNTTITIITIITRITRITRITTITTITTIARDSSTTTTTSTAAPLTTQPLEALRVTALLEFMVDSRNLEARRSQKSMRPMPVPIVRMFPLKDTDLVRALVGGKDGRGE